MKNYYFLAGLPRAGNTLLGCLINQNLKTTCLSPNSIITEIIYRLVDIKRDDSFHNFPEHRGLDKIINNVFNLYYDHLSQENIIDRGPWGTPFNYAISKNIPVKNKKYIILYRPILECLASYIKICKFKMNEELEDKCIELCSKEGLFGKNMWSIANLIKQKEKVHIIHYEKLIKDPEKIINSLLKYLKIKETFKLKNKLKQFDLNGCSYNDSMLEGPLHIIKTDNIEKTEYDIKDYVPKSIIKKYKRSDLL
tara:strand:+ start:2165 stop:2920 length:756 start_codon:yes stop_codon:yes gene_type:complete